jgi:hypothetical protein
MYFKLSEFHVQASGNTKWTGVRCKMVYGVCAPIILHLSSVIQQYQNLPLNYARPEAGNAIHYTCRCDDDDNLLMRVNSELSAIAKLIPTP